MDDAGCAFSLSLRERAGVKVAACRADKEGAARNPAPTQWRRRVPSVSFKPLTLALCLWESVAELRQMLQHVLMHLVDIRRLSGILKQDFSLHELFLIQKAAK